MPTTSSEVMSAHLGSSYGPVLQGRSDFTNESKFIPRSRGHNKLTHSSEEGTTFNFSLGFQSLPICIAQNNICKSTKGRFGLTFYKIPDLIMRLFSSYSLDFFSNQYNVTNSAGHSLDP